MKKEVYIVGRPYSLQTRLLLREGYSVSLLLCRSLKGRKVPFQTLYKKIYYVDFGSKARLFKDLKKHRIMPGLFTTLYENFITPLAWLNEYFKIAGSLTGKTAKDVTDKLSMRKKFADYDSRITPAFKPINNIKDLVKFATVHGFPLMLKPAALDKSRLVTKSQNLAELKKNYRHLIKNISKIYTESGRGKLHPQVIVEKFMRGTQHTVAALIDYQGKIYLEKEIADIVTASDVGIDDGHLFARILPSALTQTDQRKIRKVAKEGVRALGLRASPAHIEIIHTPSGPQIIEIGARIGGYRIQMYQAHGGTNLAVNEMRIKSGQNPLRKKQTVRPFCATIELFPQNKGLFKEISNLNRLKKLPSFQKISLKAKPGQPVGLARDGFKFAALILLQNKNAQQFWKDLDFVKNQVKIIIKSTKTPSPQKRLKIAHLVPDSITFPLTRPNGRYQWVFDLAVDQVREGLDVTIFCNADSDFGNSGIKKAALPGSLKMPDSRNQLLMKKALLDQSFDLYHSHFDNLHYQLAHLTDKPILFSQHLALSEETKDLHRRHHPKNVFAIPLSRHQKNQNLKYNLQTMSPVYHGIDLNLFTPSPVKQTGRFLFVGRITPQKGLAETLQFAVRHQLRLDIIGKLSPKDQSYWNKISHLVDGKKIRYLGTKKRHELVNYYRRAKALFFLIQSAEAFGLVIAEALACGCPVIATDIGHIKELVKNGRNGLVVKDLRELAIRFNEIEKISRQTCHQSALRFGWPRMLREYRSAYRKALQLYKKSP